MTDLPASDGDGPTAPSAATMGRQGGLTLVALLVNGTSRVVASLLVGRLAGPASLGVFQSGIAAAQLGGLFGPAALGSAASAFVARAESRRDPATMAAVQGHLVLRALQASAVVMATAGLAWWAARGDDPATTAGFVLLTGAFSSYAFTRGMLYGAGASSRAVQWNILTSLLSVAATWTALEWGAEGAELLAVFSLSYLVFSVANWTWVRPRRLRSPLGREIDRFTAFAILGTLASAGFLDGTMVVAAAVGEPVEVGYFGAAFALAIPASLIGAAVTLVLFPVLSNLRSQEDGRGRERIVDMCSRSVAVAVVALFAVVFILRQEVVVLLWGSTYAPAGALLAPLLLAIMLTTLAVPAANALSALTDRGIRVAAVASVAGLLTGLTTWAVAIPALGITGVAYGFLAGSLVSSATPFVLTWHETHQAWSDHAAKLAGALAALCVVAAVQDLAAPSLGSNMALAAAFVVAWLAVNLRECRQVAATASVILRR